MHKRTRWIVSLMLAITMSFSAVGVAAVASEPDSPPAALADEAICPTYEEAYNSMIALKEKYPEGMTWTNFTPYGRDGKEGTYWWNGGKVKGASGGVGCAAFAFILSDAAFGSLPARTIDSGGFVFDDVKVGDILRVNNSHFVIVLQKGAGGVTVAEGNYNKSVHWGRAMSTAEVTAANFLVTRYPENFVPADDPSANETVQSGTEGSLTWSLTKAGTLTISGNGKMPDFSSDSYIPSWNACNDAINTIVVEDGVTSIGDYAFYESEALSVYIPDSVERIGQSAFYKSAIVSITIPGSVKTIGSNAFYLCPNLTSVTVSEGVTTIDEEAFRGCTALEYIDFPASVTSVGAGAFMSCKEMTRVRFMPSNHTVTMGDNLFSQCWYLTDVTLPQTLDRISAGMFQSCSSLSSIYIPADVSAIGNLAFTQCTRLQYDGIYFGGSETTWNSIGGKAALLTLKPYDVNVEFNVEFDDPFATAPDDPGDISFEEDPNPNKCEHGNDPDTCETCHPELKCKDGNHVGSADEDGNCTNCGKPIPSDHKHAWSAAWSYDRTNHWHECDAEDCPVTDDSEKDGYAEHIYGGWTADVMAAAYQDGSRHRDCTVCYSRQTDSIPATGSSSGNSGSSSGNPGNSNDSGGFSSTEPVKKPDGSAATTTTTSTTIDELTGIKTETAKNPDGSSTVTVTQKDGTTTTTFTDTAGKAAGTEVRLSTAAINSSEERGTPAVLPIGEVEAVRDIAAAPAITVYAETGETVTVAVPTVSPTAGTVAMIINDDGSLSVVKTSVSADNSVVVSLPGEATIKIVDNSKSFLDVTAGMWSEDAIAFVSARELFSGTTATEFSPSAPMTRAMLMTVLARFDGAEMTGGETWYAQGVEWAVQRGVSDGANPNSEITREQMVTMLWRYLGSPVSANALSGYVDADQISGYARDAMCWAVENGIANGFGNGLLNPQGQATRAQVAQILKNLIENIALNPSW